MEGKSMYGGRISFSTPGNIGRSVPNDICSQNSEYLIIVLRQVEHTRE